MVQCFRTCLPMQGTLVWVPAWETKIPHARGKEALGPQPEKPSCLIEDPAQPKQRQQTRQGSFVRVHTQLDANKCFLSKIITILFI